MKIKSDNNKDLRQENLEDTLEFISLDDVGIEKYSRTALAFVKNIEEEEDEDEDYEDIEEEYEYYEDCPG